MLNIGCTSRAFAGRSTGETAARMREIGFQCTELCFVHEDLSGWTYNGIGSLEGITEETVRQKAMLFRENGVEVASLGIFTDLRSPETDARAKALEYFRRYIAFAAEAGIPRIASGCGFTPGKRGLSADSYEEDYARLREFLGTVCEEAEKSGVRIALEGCVLDIIPTPRRLKTLIEELEEAGHVRLGALLDPADFLAADDEEGMFRHLKHDISYFHGKDRKIHAARGVNMGDGDVDWIKFMELYIRHTDKTPFILDNCDADSCARLRERALDYYDKAFHRLLGRIN